MSESHQVAIKWSTIFDTFATKEVSHTDKTKGAYVLTAQQRAIMLEAGISPGVSGKTPPLTIDVLFDPNISKIAATYYDSIRAGSGRVAETRMGTALISKWLEEGDTLVIGRVGSHLFLAKGDSKKPSPAEFGRILAKTGNRKKIFENANKAHGKPAKKQRIISDFVRNPNVVAAALLRSGGKCEMPACSRKLFKRDDGTAFLEVHHVHPLGEGGDDSLGNAAALCPMCHRELHFGSKRYKKRATLASYINSLPIS